LFANSLLVKLLVCVGLYTLGRNVLLAVLVLLLGETI